MKSSTVLMLFLGLDCSVAGGTGGKGISVDCSSCTYTVTLSLAFMWLITIFVVLKLAGFWV